MLYIPLGMRCSTASIVRYQLNLIDVSLPFDWCQMTSESIAKWITIGPDKDFIKEFFSTVNNGRNIIGDWFPHEQFWDDRLIDKYLRRSIRLHDFLKSDDDKTFFIMCGSVTDVDNIYSVLAEKCNSRMKIITVNMGKSLNENIEQHDIFIPLQNGWDLWETEVISSLKNIL